MAKIVLTQFAVEVYSNILLVNKAFIYYLKPQKTAAYMNSHQLSVFDDHMV